MQYEPHAYTLIVISSSVVSFQHQLSACTAESDARRCELILRSGDRGDKSAGRCEGEVGSNCSAFFAVTQGRIAKAGDNHTSLAAIGRGFQMLTKETERACTEGTSSVQGQQMKVSSAIAACSAGAVSER